MRAPRPLVPRRASIWRQCRASRRHRVRRPHGFESRQIRRVLQTARLHRSPRRRQILAQRSRDESHSWHQGRRIPHGQAHHQHQSRRADPIHSVLARIPRDQAAQRDGGENPLGTRLHSHRSRCPRRRETVGGFESGQHAVALHLGRQADCASRPNQRHDGVHHRSRRNGRRDRRTAPRARLPWAAAPRVPPIRRDSITSA